MSKKYDIAISFAGENREVAMGIATILTSQEVTVFYDEFEKADLWGKDLYEHLISIYKDNSKYCLMLLSEAYSKKLWTSHERKAAQARAFKENKEYILPLKLDNTEVPGILDTVGYIDFSSETIESISQLILKKLWGDLETDKGLNILKDQLEELYMRVMLVCELSFAPKKHESYGKIGLAQTMHDGARQKFLKLKSDIQINAPIIDQLILGQITQTIDAFENILERARFLINLHNPKLIGNYFISEIPEEDFNLIYTFLEKLKIFEGYAIKNKRHYTPDEIINMWKVAEKESDRYCSSPSEFKGQTHLVPMLFNYITMRKLTYPADKVQVFKDSN